MEEVVEEKPWNRFARKVSEVFLPEYELETETGYQRRILDRGMEEYLDAHFDEYISTYELVTEVDIESLERRHELIENRVKELKDFSLDMDANVSNLEKRVEKLKEAMK